MIRRRRDGERGQGLVEFSFIVPVFMLFLLGMLELGFAFDHLLTISYATREGARSGAALADGSNLPTCGDVDKYVVSAVERVLELDGSPVKDNLARVSAIRIFKADSSGNQIGTMFNEWTPGAGPTVDGRALVFKQTTYHWDPCLRSNTTVNPDSIGVSIQYTYQAVTPLAGILNILGGGGWSSLPMSDRSIMALNPTD